MNILDEAKELFDIEIHALKLVKEALDYRFEHIIDLIVNCKGKVVITGMGKPGHIGSKIAATMASLGTPSFFLHPAEALHGDLGMIEADDLIIAISFSGESEEITRILPNIKLIGAKLVAISGNENSTLVSASDYSFIFPKFNEACSMNLAPTSSTTATLVFGDALAVCVSKIYGFREENYALFHPAGSLGKHLLLKVSDLMHEGEKNAVVSENTNLVDAIVEMSTKGLGVVNIVNKEKLLGVITDGDLRRTLHNKKDIYTLDVDAVMTKNPIVINKNMLAIEALKIMNQKVITAIPVVDKDYRLEGLIKINDIISAGIVL